MRRVCKLFEIQGSIFHVGDPSVAKKFSLALDAQLSNNPTSKYPRSAPEMTTYNVVCAHF